MAYMNVHPASPIGVFDSGLGGLSVLRQLQSELPRESIIYAADSRYCPYGERSIAEICERSFEMMDFLVRAGAKIVVVACNTASAAAIELLRKMFDVPVIAMEPAVKPAVALSRSGKIAVLATPSTAASERLRSLIARFGEGFDIRPIGVAGLADCVEAGTFDGPAVRSLLADLVAGQIGEGVDVVILGCTHYPFVDATIRDLAGPSVRVVDSGNAVARRTRDVLMNSGLLNGIGSTPDVEFHTTGDPERVAPIVERMVGYPVRLNALAARPPAAVH
jgi:glutamate racemase